MNGQWWFSGVSWYKLISRLDQLTSSQTFSKSSRSTDQVGRPAKSNKSAGLRDAEKFYLKYIDKTLNHPALILRPQQASTRCHCIYRVNLTRHTQSISPSTFCPLEDK